MRDETTTSEETSAVAGIAADTLAAVSGGLESAAEGAHDTGLALRDRGRDTAKAIARSETRVRKHGLLGTAAGLALRVRGNAREIALAGAGLVTLLWVRRRASGK